MVARVSAEMVKAHKLLRLGDSPAEAARKTGLNQSSISRCKVCQEIIRQRNLPPPMQPINQA